MERPKKQPTKITQRDMQFGVTMYAVIFALVCIGFLFGGCTTFRGGSCETINPHIAVDGCGKR